jgi:glycosyltransferase involved in cell wall biosynthesis
MEPEYGIAGLTLTDHSPYDRAYFEREEEEYALADYHCVASTVVREQLLALGISAHRIWLVPYGADPLTFTAARKPESDSTFRILFAGQVCLRKGIRTLFEALTKLSRPDWRVDFYGARVREANTTILAYRGATPLCFHGPVRQEELAAAMRESTVLVLPSLEEGFGLVVPQAMNCGLPCIVSDRVGAKDLVRHRKNGSIFRVQDSDALATELQWWSSNRTRTDESFDWTAPARRLIALTAATN